MLMNEYGDRETDGSSTTRRLTALRPFPIVLFEVLARAENDLEYQAILRWEPIDGKAFVIFDRERFATEIMPNHFPYQTQYPSFRRQLNIYGFTRISERGSESAIFSHPDFRRGCPDLCRTIRRTVHPRRKSTSTKQSFVAGIRSTNFTKRSNSTFLLGSARSGEHQAHQAHQKRPEQSIGGLGDNLHEGATTIHRESARFNAHHEVIQGSVRPRIPNTTEHNIDFGPNSTLQILATKPSNAGFAALSLPRGEVTDPDQSTWFNNLSHEAPSNVSYRREFHSSVQEQNAGILTQVLSKHTSELLRYEKQHANSIQEKWPVIQTSYDKSNARNRIQQVTFAAKTSAGSEPSQPTLQSQTLHSGSAPGSTLHVLPPSYIDNATASSTLNSGGERQEQATMEAEIPDSRSFTAAEPPSRQHTSQLQLPIQLMHDELTRMAYTDSTNLFDAKKRSHQNHSYIGYWIRDVSLQQHQQRLVNVGTPPHGGGYWTNSAHPRAHCSDEESSDMVHFLEDVDLDDDDLG